LVLFYLILTHTVMTNLQNKNCPICTEQYNHSNRMIVPCVSCAFSCCSHCIRIYLKMDSTLYPQCMNCHVEWSTEFLSTYFPKSFLWKEYASKLKTWLYQKEISFVADTQQDWIDHQKQLEIQSRIKAITNRIKLYKRMIQELSEQILRLSDESERIKETRALSSGVYHNNGIVATCLRPHCLGYFIRHNETSLICPLCRINACPICMCEIDLSMPPHQCESSTLKSIQIIRNDCKPCPKCHVLIYKEEGCDQMWCTLCHVLFSWKTGQPLRQISWIHNPHYLEYVRSGRSDTRDVPLLPPYGLIAMLVQSYPKRDPIYYVYAQTVQLRDITLTQLGRSMFQHNYQTFLRERIEYMSKRISEQQYREFLFRKNKAKDKCNELSYWIRSFIQHISDTFHIIAEKNQPIVNDHYYESFHKIIMTHYDTTEKILRKYDSSVTNPFRDLYYEFMNHL